MKQESDKYIIWGLFGGLVALLAVAAYHVNKNVGLLKSAVVKLVNVNLSTKKPEQWTVDFTFMFENRSDIDIEVTGYVFDFKVNDVGLGKIVPPENMPKQYIAAKSKSTLNVVAAFNPNKVWANFINKDFLTSLLSDYMDMGVSIKGYISAKHKALSIQNIPVEYTVKVADFIGGKREIPSASKG